MTLATKIILIAALILSIIRSVRLLSDRREKQKALQTRHRRKCILLLRMLCRCFYHDARRR